MNDLVKRLRRRFEYEWIDGSKRIEWEDEDALAAADRIEQLIFGPGGIMEMKQTIADKEKRIAQLETIIEWSGMPYPEDK